MADPPPFQSRATWSNHLGNQSVDPLRIYEPETIEQVAAIVKAAEEAGVTVRAVGSGHSWSDVALTTGYVVKTDRLARVPAGEPDFIARERASRPVVRAEAGTRVKELNAYLDGQGLALSNMGGYDHQTVAGVISTSTHGSGIAFGPFNDFVRSLDLVASNGRVYRIEPHDGPTDRAIYQAHHRDRRTLVQSDDWFHAAVVGMGCMGIVCTVLLEVEPKYFLREVRTFRIWEQCAPTSRTERRCGEAVTTRFCSAPTGESTTTPAWSPRATTPTTPATSGWTRGCATGWSSWPRSSRSRRS